MPYDFDEIIERKATNSLKYDFAAERGKPDNVIPLWVADMDFRTPPEVTDALIAAARHGIFGYPGCKRPYFDAVRDWYLTHHLWEPDSSWLIRTPGVVFAICNAIQTFTEPGDCVIIQRPVYYPFSEAILDNDRTLINNPLILTDGRYIIDFDDFETKIKDNHVKLFILSNPHNPVGRVWSREELARLGDICLKYGVLVVADEIHADFTFPGYRHTIFASIKPEFENITITCTAPSKTFNLAGLQVSNIFITNREIRRAFRKNMLKTGFLDLNTMGLIACQAAYEKGLPWLEELRNYLKGNLDYIRVFLTEQIPEIRIIEPEGTYLIWLDCRALGMSDNELDRFIVHEAGLWLDNGSMFGTEGEGFQRINIACPRATLEKAFSQLKQAVDKLDLK
jgi:cystathionine beta-lyase